MNKFLSITLPPPAALIQRRIWQTAITQSF
jgi:hypothetical protein